MDSQFVKKILRSFLLFAIYSLLFTHSLNSKEFTVASYNVENLFDLKHDGTEYKEFIPYSSSKWNKHSFLKKINNIVKVINELDADIIALQEIESQDALNTLVRKIPTYRYHTFYKHKTSSVGLAFISKFPIIKSTAIHIKSSLTINRPILKSVFKIDNKKLTIYNNHWRSKRAGENERIIFAKTLMKKLQKEAKDTDYIILGDLNSNYNEHITFKTDKKLNNSYGLTGINHVLNSVIDERYITKDSIADHKKRVHYNLWLDLNTYERFSYKYRSQNATPDNILLSSALFDTKGISYVDHSFNVFKPGYLYKNDIIQRWKINKSGIHQAKGYSDHLPIIASFTTQKYVTSNKFSSSVKPVDTISYLYGIEQLDKPYELKDVVVIYKYKNSAVLKQFNDRAIYAYKCAHNLKLGHIYDLSVSSIHIYNGLKEVTSISDIAYKGIYENFKTFYKDASNIDIFNPQYQNEIITNLKGKFKRGYLHFGNNKRIKLYSKDKKILPKNEQNIKINSGHLGNYKGKVQIVIYNQKDIYQ